MRVQPFPKVLWWPLMLRLEIAIELLKQMSTIQQTLNVRFSGVTKFSFYWNVTRGNDKQYKGEKLHYQQVQTTWVQWMYSNKTLLQSNLIVNQSLRKLNQIIIIKKIHFSNIIEWKTPSDHWRGGLKWVGEGRVETVHMWNKCPG